MSNEIVRIFESEDFGKVRTLIINDEPWFVGKDVAEILKYANPQKAIRSHVDEEDKGVSVLDTPGGKQETIIINESGLYCLIVSSKLPDAKRFKRWVTSEVLPSIRKTGSYSIQRKPDSYMIEDPIERAERWIEEEKERQSLRLTVQEQQEEIERKENVIIGLVDEISLADKRQILNRVVRCGHGNFQQRWGILYREFENKYHIDLERRVKRYNSINEKKIKSKIDYIDRVLNKIPELYELAAKLFENDVNRLKEELYGAATK